MPLVNQRTDSDLAHLVLTAKFGDIQWSVEDATVAMAVCLAETAGNALCCPVNWSPGTRYHCTLDRGLWAFNSLAHPEVTDVMAFTSWSAAREAIRIWSTSGWSPWNTFKSGAHMQFMPRCKTAIAARPASERSRFPSVGQMMER
jgi:hypothetical protein